MLSVDEQMRIITSGAAQIVPEADLRKKLEKGEPLNIKLGVDPTSPDLHLGHAVPLRKMRQFQDLGHNVTLIIGNGTALIGDPSGKNSTRPQLSQEQIEANAETYVSQAMKILDPEKTTIVHNGDWILSMDLAGLLQVCSKFTVARILERDDFTKRYQSQTPIALHEFLYPVMQAFDSVQIKADVEMGGTDQLFNLLAGRELMEKMGMEPQIALTMPLLEGTDGVRKMSKSYGNYIGLTDAPKDMFGKTMSIPDEMIGKYYRLASSLTPAEVDKIDAALADGSADPYELKRALGRDLCDTYHGAGAGDEAQAEFDRVFKEGQLADFPEKHVELTVNDEGQIYLAGLLKDLDKACRVAEAVIRGAKGTPVTVKMRLGWDKGNIVCLELSKLLESVGVSALTVHGRTKVQMYSGTANWDYIREVKNAVSIPVIANGDVFSGPDAERILRYTGADGVMIARGVFGNPWIFQQAQAAIAGKPIPPLPPLAERCKVAVRQFELAAKNKSEKIACLEARKHYAWYLKGVPYAGYWKSEISKITTLEDVYRVTAGIQRELKDPPSLDDR